MNAAPKLTEAQRADLVDVFETCSMWSDSEPYVRAGWVVRVRSSDGNLSHLELTDAGRAALAGSK